jgi:hypothetical protein
MSDPFQTETPDDPRGGFNLSPEGCVNGTAWGGEITLDGSPIEAPYAEYQGHSSGGVSRSAPVV